jgi:SAM-dependent methyltransferase
MSSRSTPMHRVFLILLAGTAPLMAVPQTDREPDVGYVVTPDPVVTAMLELAAVGPDDLVVDLGSGDGRIPIVAARDFGATGWGVEINRDLVTRSRKLAEQDGVADRVHFDHGDIFETDFSQADVVALYLLPELNLRLRPQILAMKAGTRVVSHEFDMGEWPPDRKQEVGNRPIYLWMVPTRVEGEWLISDGERRLHLSLEQHFQRFSGRARWEDEESAVRDARIDGNTFSFSLHVDSKWLVFRGQATDDGIEQLESAPALSGFRPVTQWEMTRATAVDD